MPFKVHILLWFMHRVKVESITRHHKTISINWFKHSPVKTITEFELFRGGKLQRLAQRTLLSDFSIETNLRVIQSHKQKALIYWL